MTIPMPVVQDPADIYPPRAGNPLTHAQWSNGSKGPMINQSLLKENQRRNQSNGKKTLTDWVRQVNQAVLSLDEGIGRVMETLKETGELDNTLVIFTSDQGFAWGQHGFQVKKAPYDANIRSPMIVSMPTRYPQGRCLPTPGRRSRPCPDHVLDRWNRPALGDAWPRSDSTFEISADKRLG